ncbi:hypothetical protein KKG22_04720 [Patescibacteria group bacterium]|nr:hypothetical protein [Patescibacteria group bacterium]MBU1721639.1 hypothetical protein [Patescibacteria group bacterium]MBU1901699.1 hypothetical protein [Patescibacteria group bacterium]
MPEKKTLIAVLVSILFTTIIIGGGVYFWGDMHINELESSCKVTMNELEETVDTLVEDKEEADELCTIALGEVGQVKSSTDLDLPVVTYARAGVLSAEEKALVVKKLVEPYIDYHNEDMVDLIALDITVPAAVGDAYQVIAIFHDGVREGFTFAARGDISVYWAPTCMNDCPFTDAFREKYPEIVGE